MTKTLRAKT